ncbi:MAG: translation initiation factor IF-2 [Candidatus Cryptobacteroides sp.]
MSEIRLNKLVKKYNIGLQDLVNFLAKEGVEVDLNPNAKVEETPELLAALSKTFGKDLQDKQAAEEVDIKLSKILENTSKKLKEEPEEEELEQMITIKTNTLSDPVLKPETSPKTEPVLKPEISPVEETAPAPVEEEKKVEEQIVPEEKVETPEELVVETPVEEVKEEKEVKEEVQEKVEEKVVEKVEESVAQPVVSVSTPTETSSSQNGGLKVIGKIDLSQFDKKPSNKKRERISKQKVDLAKAGQNATNNRANPSKNQQNQQNAQGSGKKNKKQRQNDRNFRPALTEAQQEEMQKEIQKQVKETYARMNEGKKNNFGAKYRKEKRDAAAQRTQEEMQQLAAENKVLKVTEFVTVNDLATLMNNTPVNKVIGACMSLGLMVSINQRLDAEALVLVAEEFGYSVEFVTAGITEEIKSTQEEDREEDKVERPPIITVMGHVDHGKTSLLDYIRKANVIAGEAGGITQHIGAYNVTLENGRHITFLDTPGHEAFTAMRARGAQMTDLAIIIIAADDAVMPQTIEAINHAQAANVPMVFAINKIDKPGANSDTIRRQLSEMNILVEDWGGKYQCQEISAKQGIGVDKLLDKVLLETDLLELKANPKKLASGAVIESSLDKGRGYLATILVQDGTLHVGDCILCGSFYGRVKSMFNERGQKVAQAGPSTPVSVLGLNGAPAAGEKFNVLADEKEAKSIANKREQLIRIQGIKTQKHMTLEEIGRRIAIGNFKELNIIVKGDVDGSVEALSDSLIKLSTDEVKVNVIHKAVGAISESDILLAQASDAVIVGFQVRPSVEARRAAEKEGIEIRLYSVIYDCINEVKDGIEGMLEPEKKEEVIATAEVKQTFRISKVGTIAGCIIRDGKMIQKAQVRLIRDGIVIYTGELSSLQIGKDAVKEVGAGKECGMGIAGYNDIKDGDVIEAFHIVEIKRTL